MINYDLNNLFYDDSAHKNFILRGSSGVVLTNEDLHAEQFKFVESLNSEENLRFGSCESSYIEFTCNNSFKKLGKYVDVQLIIDNHTEKPLDLGRFYIVSDDIADDKKERKIVAFDSLNKVLNKNCASWYAKQTYPMTLKAFRNAFFSYVGIAQETTTLANDSLKVYKTVKADVLSGLDILTAICEINGVFGHMTNKNKFRYVTLRPISKGLYPSESLYPSNDLFPRDEPTTEKINRNIYSYCSGADYDVAPIDCLNIKQEENDVGVTVGSGTNQYNIIGNFLAFGLSTQELTTAANNAFDVIKRASYAPVLLNVKGNYCRELGDQLRIYTSDRILYTYILNRTIEGIQSLNEAIEATGTELQEEDINSVYSSIEQLRGKSNVLTRTLEETRSEITDIESGLSSKIQQNASSIELEVKQRKGADDVLASSIKQTADNIKAEVLAKEGGNVNSFGWNLTSTKFTLSANGKAVFECDKNGVVITGGGKFTGEIIANSGTIGGCKINNGLLEVSAARITSGTINSARIPNLDASKITAGTISTDRLSADVITTKSWTSQKITADMVGAGVISADKITTGSFAASRVTAGTINNRRVTWQRFEYMEGLNWEPLYKSGSYLTNTYNGTQPVGYMVTSIKSHHLFTLAQIDE